MSTLVDQAFQIASFAYAGRKDGAEKPYILHAARVALGLSRPEEQAVALLHGALEANGQTKANLLTVFPARIVDAIEVLTRGEDDGYDAYIARVAKHPLARTVKAKLIEDNLDLGRIEYVTEEDKARSARYAAALKVLKA